MALCVRVCWRLNEFEGIWRQDWLLSSGERALQGISLKKVNSLGSRVEQETLPSTRVLRRSGYMWAGSPESSLPGSRPCFPFSVDLPCCCCGCCCEEVALSKYKKKKAFGALCQNEPPVKFILRANEEQHHQQSNR